MNCKDIEQLQNAYVDRELDPANSRAFAEHVSSCSTCAMRMKELSALQQVIKAETTRYALPPDLYSKIAATGQNTYMTPTKWQPFKWGSAGAGLALAACLAFFMVVRPDSEYMLEQQLLSSHIRSLQTNHLTDVISTDQHTVKPWFNGRLDVSPPVMDLIADGFPLIGGRLDYVDQHAAAVIVYRHNAHIINLFVWPATQLTFDGASVAVQQGYNMRHWHNGDLQFWAISDVNPDKLSEFENLYRLKTGTAK